jgi:hypothetical protein
MIAVPAHAGNFAGSKISDALKADCCPPELAI